jgi:hypothetical protein
MTFLLGMETKYSSYCYKVKGIVCNTELSSSCFKSEIETIYSDLYVITKLFRIFKLLIVSTINSVGFAMNDNKQKISKKLQEYLIGKRGGPDPVREYAGFAVDAVKNAIDVDLLMENVDLSFLDYYLDNLGEVNPSVARLAAATTGIYFGEIIRMNYPGIWHLEDEDEPLSWEVRFKSCPLAIRPVCIAVEVMKSREEQNVDASFIVHYSRKDLLKETLDKATPMSESTYFSFGGRYDVISLAEDFLSGVEQKLFGHLNEKQKKMFNQEFGCEDPR